MRRTVLAVTVLALATPALADDPPTYQDVAAKRAENDGKTVRFRFTFTRLSPSVNPFLGARGITDKSHVEIQTVPRPPKGAGGLLLLVSRRNERLLEKLAVLEARREVVLTGRVGSLTADNGASFYYVEITGLEEPEEEPGDEPSGDEPEYEEVEAEDLSGRLLEYDGRRIRIEVAFGGFAKPGPGWAYRLAGIEPEDAVALEGPPHFAVLAPKEDAETLEALRAVRRGDRLVLSGTLHADANDRGARAVLILEEMGKPDR